jgi:hypothetical protein
MAEPKAIGSGGGSRPGSVPPEHRQLWADAPVLRTTRSGYGGRVTVEVWVDGRVLWVSNSRALVPGALAALKSGSKVQEAPVDLSQTPMTGLHPHGTAFLGRVIIEFWPDGPVVAASGTDSRLLDYAVQELSKQFGGPI